MRSEILYINIFTKSHFFFTTLTKRRIATRSKKPKNSQKSGAPHFGKNITTFAKADLPSDDEEDVEQLEHKIRSKEGKKKDKGGFKQKRFKSS